MVSEVHKESQFESVVVLRVPEEYVDCTRGPETKGDCVDNNDPHENVPPHCINGHALVLELVASPFPHKHSHASVPEVHAARNPTRHLQGVQMEAHLLEKPRPVGVLSTVGGEVLEYVEPGEGQRDAAVRSARVPPAPLGQGVAAPPSPDETQSEQAEVERTPSVQAPVILPLLLLLLLHGPHGGALRPVRCRLSVRSCLVHLIQKIVGSAIVHVHVHLGGHAAFSLQYVHA